MSILTPPIGPDDHVVGNPSARVTLVEFGDYECPYCGHAQPIVHAIVRKLGRRLLLAFRHFPLAKAHPHALGAAVAAEAAGVQGKFWPMHELLFDNQDALDVEDLVGYAESLGLDLARFAEDLESDVLLDRVRSHFTSGVRSGVNGTPTFFIDGVRFDGSWDLDSLTTALERALARKEGASPGLSPK
jgi:protein-disulfide isomerase